MVVVGSDRFPETQNELGILSGGSERVFKNRVQLTVSNQEIVVIFSLDLDPNFSLGSGVFTFESDVSAGSYRWLLSILSQRNKNLSLDYFWLLQTSYEFAKIHYTKYMK